MIRSFDDGPGELPLVGGKAASLMQMRAAGLPVPPGFCVTSTAYDEFCVAAGVAAHLERLRAPVPAGIAPDPAEVASALRAQLAEAALPPAVGSAIGHAWEDLACRASGSLLVAARSSAVLEDGAVSSFAGLYETYLNLARVDEVLTAVLDCYRALWSDRAMHYRSTRGIDHGAERMAVVVMEMVPADVAGVAFSLNPLSGSPDEVFINASWGLGESVVSGLVTPDQVVARKADAGVLDYQIGDKELEILRAGDGGGNVQREVEPERRAMPCLDDCDVAAIVELARRAEEHYGRPQDIEVARANGQWFLLQARPITAHS